MSGQRGDTTIGAAAAEVLAALRECSRIGMVEATVGSWRSGSPPPYTVPRAAEPVARLYAALVNLDTACLASTAGIRVVHISHAPYDVYIGRAMPRRDLAGSKWANPYRIGQDGDHAEVLARYEAHVRGRPDLMASLDELEGKTLGCWCKVPGDELPCHGDVLARLVAERHRG